MKYFYVLLLFVSIKSLIASQSITSFDSDASSLQLSIIMPVVNLNAHVVMQDYYSTNMGLKSQKNSKLKTVSKMIILLRRLQAQKPNRSEKNKTVEKCVLGSDEYADELKQAFDFQRELLALVPIRVH